MMPSVGQCGPNCGKIYIFARPGNKVLQNYDVFDPRTNSYTPFPLGETPGVPRQLVDGRVFFGGGDESAVFLNPATKVYAPTAPHPFTGARYSSRPDGPVLPNGDVFYGTDSGLFPRSTGIYKPQKDKEGTWEKVDSCIPGGRALDSNNCLIVGSLTGGSVLAIQSEQSDSVAGDYKVWVYNPATKAWSPTAPLNNKLSYGLDAVLLDPAGVPCGAYCNKMLVVGRSAEVYTPCPGDPLFVGPVACRPV